MFRTVIHVDLDGHGFEDTIWIDHNQRSTMFNAHHPAQPPQTSHAYARATSSSNG